MANAIKVSIYPSEEADRLVRFLSALDRSSYNRIVLEAIDFYLKERTKDLKALEIKEEINAYVEALNEKDELVRRI
ncbi:hypothetical protein GS597_09025 [Synechococcales cyanobacterium C]|uniref:Uncharacterized protein n=1 Tax=Petrachloros mirabilis ULC683 TaxID=2781853 RepID=A0A8K1ZWV6_9CYAN|nr:hypothetical protein [Petrachloros mirabilis]NCJ06644.1 hypothetical protein [Petrachloros mirabilis ULC683]